MKLKIINSLTNLIGTTLNAYFMKTRSTSPTQIVSFRFTGVQVLESDSQDSILVKGTFTGSGQYEVRSIIFTNGTFTEEPLLSQEQFIIEYDSVDKINISQSYAIEFKLSEHSIKYQFKTDNLKDIVPIDQFKPIDPENSGVDLVQPSFDNYAAFMTGSNIAGYQVPFALLFLPYKIVQIKDFIINNEACLSVVYDDNGEVFGDIINLTQERSLLGTHFDADDSQDWTEALILGNLVLLNDIIYNYNTPVNAQLQSGSLESKNVLMTEDNDSCVILKDSLFYSYLTVTENTLNRLIQNYIKNLPNQDTLIYTYDFYGPIIEIESYRIFCIRIQFYQSDRITVESTQYLYLRTHQGVLDITDSRSSLKSSSTYGILRESNKFYLNIDYDWYEYSFDSPNLDHNKVPKIDKPIVNLFGRDYYLDQNKLILC